MVEILANLQSGVKGPEGIAEIHLERDKEEFIVGFVEFKNS